jgi:hypothetical protein
LKFDVAACLADILCDGLEIIYPPRAQQDFGAVRRQKSACRLADTAGRTRDCDDFPFRSNINCPRRF